MAAKPRILTDHKDMIWSLIPLIAICAIIAVVSGNCSVGLTGGASDDKTPAYDVQAGLTANAASLPFPVRLPETPQGWKPNTGSTAGIDATSVSNTGYLTTDGAYMQLSQTNAPEDSLVGYLSPGQALGRGTITVGEKQWVQYRTDNDRSIWVANLGDVRIGLYSKGGDGDFTTMAMAVLAAPVIPRSALPVPTG